MESGSGLSSPKLGLSHRRPWIITLLQGNEAADLAKQALDEYSGSESEYRSSLEQIRTAMPIEAGLYEVERLQKAAEDTTGGER